MVDRLQLRRLRLTGVGLYAIAAALVVWQSLRYSARIDEVDAGYGYLDPFDIVLPGMAIACVVIAVVILRRLD